MEELKKEFYQIGIRIYFLSEDEAALLHDLSDHNLLKFTLKKIDFKEIYGYHKNESE
jgi:hypothetical protein